MLEILATRDFNFFLKFYLVIDLEIVKVFQFFQVILSTTSASVSSWVPNTEKQMKTRGCFGRVLLLFRGVWKPKTSANSRFRFSRTVEGESALVSGARSIKINARWKFFENGKGREHYKFSNFKVRLSPRV